MAEKQIGRLLRGFVLFCFIVLMAQPSSAAYYKDCKESVHIIVDLNDGGGKVEIYYIDCGGKNRRIKIRNQRVSICALSRYEVRIVVTPDGKYEFVGWGTDNIWWWKGDVYFFPCQDLILIPRFQKDPYRYKYDDNGCFIKTTFKRKRDNDYRHYGSIGSYDIIVLFKINYR